MRKTLLALVSGFVSSVSAVEVRVASFNIGAHFGETYFDYSLGDAGTPDHESVKAVLSRINADVVALQEIHTVDLQGSPDDLDDLAASLGYPYLHVAPLTGAFDTSLRVIIMSRFPFLAEGNIGSPAGAMELTRLHPVVKIDVPGTTNDLVMISAHLKAGTLLADRFRRAVEMKRIVGHLAAAGLTNDDNYVILGDFNPSAINATFNTLPSGLPGSYVLGSDITFPVNYSTNLLSYFSTPGAARIELRQLDGSSSTYDTTAPNGPALDAILVSPAIAGRLSAAEIYNSVLDVSNGTGLLKSGSPPPTATSATASDHYAVFADLELDSDYPNLALGLSASSVREGASDGTVTATVTLPAARPAPVTVTVASDDALAATAVPATVVIPAGALAGSAAIRTPRNFTVDPQRSVTFTASATGYDPANAVLQVNDADGPYVFASPGQTVAENFNGFTGNHDPAPWVTSGGAWKGIDSGASVAAGLRSYGVGGDGSLGFLPQGAGTTAMAGFVNNSSVPITALRISLDAEQWRAGLNGTADSISAELVTAGGTIPLPGLAFSANRFLPSGPVAGGATANLTTTAVGLLIPPGAPFSLRVNFHAGSNAGVPPADVFVNEFHYDNTGTDTGEFVEIAAGPGFTGALSSVSLVIYNGSDGKAAATTHPLDTFVAGAVMQSGHRLYHKWIPGLQNDTEGFAVVSVGAVLHFISYEGSFTAVNGPAAGMTSTNIGVSQNGEPLGLAALGLTGTGGSAADFTWTKFSGIAHSPGQPNNGQSFLIPTLPPQGLAIDNLSVTFLTDHDGDGMPDESDPDDDNDGQADAYEAAFGSDPQDAASRFSPVLARSSAPPHGFQLSFPSAPGIVYTVQSCTDLADWQALTTVSGNGGVVIVPLPSAEPRRFFRVKAGN